MITIGQLAGFAGVTVKAVRHYHKVGLLDEPPRDSSGYRRYSAEHAIALVKIKTLADAGVPLARIKDLLADGAADPDRFAAAIAEIDRKLQDRITELLHTRERLAQLTHLSGERLFVSSEVAGYLGRLRELGVSERTVQMERDTYILLHAIAPEDAAIVINDKRDMLDDPEFRALYLEYDEAFNWSADDPRLYALADRSRRWIANRQSRSVARESSEGGGRGERAVEDPVVAQLFATSFGATSRAWKRLNEIAKERKAGG